MKDVSDYLTEAKERKKVIILCVDEWKEKRSMKLLLGMISSKEIDLCQREKSRVVLDGIPMKFILILLHQSAHV